MTTEATNAMCIICTDRHRSVEFYKAVFGAEIIRWDVGTCPWLRIGDLNVTLLQNTKKTSDLAHSETAMALMLLQVDDVRAVYDRATQHGARVIEPLKSDDDFFIVADPDGIIIEVMRSESDVE